MRNERLVHSEIHSSQPTFVCDVNPFQRFNAIVSHHTWFSTFIYIPKFTIHVSFPFAIEKGYDHGRSYISSLQKNFVEKYLSIYQY